MSDPDDVAAFRKRLAAARVPSELRDAVQRALEKEDVVDGAFRAWRVTKDNPPDALQLVSSAWLEKAQTHADANQLSHAIYACERALELRPGFTEAVTLLQAANARRDAGPWLVMRHDSYAREDSVVGEYANKSAAETRAKELIAETGDHHWATATR